MPPSDTIFASATLSQVSQNIAPPMYIWGASWHLSFLLGVTDVGTTDVSRRSDAY